MPAAPASFRVRVGSSGAREGLALRIQQERKLVVRDPELLPSRQRRAGGAHAVALVITRRTGITGKGRWRKPRRSQYFRGARMSGGSTTEYEARFTTRCHGPRLPHSETPSKSRLSTDGGGGSGPVKAHSACASCAPWETQVTRASAKLNPWPNHRNATSGPS